MAAREKINFKILPSSLDCCSAGDDMATKVTHFGNTTTTAADHVPPGDLVSSAIAAVVGKDTATLAAKPTPFEEADVEVEILALTQDQHLILYASCRSLFSSNAWIAIGANMQSKENEIPEIILPLCTQVTIKRKTFGCSTLRRNLGKLKK